ncbi:Chromosome partition protein Smc [bioreactor metagenome]|uniref:Chromosome partition protein Smc n=1 Tax=bioreactor metagenome TaxID=1076179 RepID=A0A644XPU0_9ZZZZ
MEDNALSSRMNMLAEMEKMYEGYSKAVKLVMSESGRGELPGIHGPVAGLLRVSDRYAVAVEIALGGAMQNIVVDNEESAKKAISSLKRRDGGRATFLPLTSIRPNQLRERDVKQEQGFVGVASELVEHDDVYSPVFSNLLGRVVIAEDMDSAIAMARKYHYGFRIVTLDGQVMNPGGSMTGGSVSHSAGILSRANELDRLRAQMEKLKGDLAAAAKASEEANREAAAAVYEMETAQSQLRELDDSILTLTGKLENRESQLTALAGRRSELKTQIENLSARGAKAEADMEAARARIGELEGSAAELQSEAEGKSRGQSDLKTRMDKISEALAKFRMERAALEAEKAALSKAVSELEVLRRDIEGDRSQRESLISDYENRNEALRGEILAAEKDMEKIRGDREQAASAIAAVTAQKLELERRRNITDKDSRDKNQELLSLEREVSVLEQKKLAAQMEEKQILDKLWETYELTSEGAKAQRMTLESLPKAGRRVSELKRMIAELGNINIDAIGEFERVNERYTYFIDQRNDVQKSKAELENIINDITGEMKVIFRREFESIRTSFSETFLELFGGGKATLELENEEDILNCGIEIKVQPPGKALKIISLLSGGEKAFVAIALYFAILKVRPTPFCVLDEIEAALDDNNVVRFADYMRRITSKTQFIVITHRRGTMEAADVLYGVTMQEQGISRMLTISLNDVEKELQIG